MRVVPRSPFRVDQLPVEAPPMTGDLPDLTPETALHRTVEEGRRRLSRAWAPLLATGLVGGIDVGTGVLGLLLVEDLTGSKLLGGLAFGIGFIALTLARSELFTEDFLVPVTAVVARQARLRQLWRLWGGTMVANLAGGWLVTWLVIAGFPEVRDTAIETGAFYDQLPAGRAFALAVLGGLAITLMTWMQHSTESVAGKLVPAVTTAFLLGAGSLNHAIVCSLLMFAALHTGMAPFGYLDWMGTAAWASVGNIVGGIGLVTVLRLLQAPGTVARQRANPLV